MITRSVSGGERRGFALITVIMLTLGMAALAASAIYLSGNSQLLGTSIDREREFKYGAEAAMAMGKSRLNTDALVLPDTGYVTLMSGDQIIGADGLPLPGVSVNLYTGPTGSNSGQFGRFASVVAEARDGQGARFVRRLELTQESFARFAYWSNQEKNSSGGIIYFANNDQLWGPVWSNDIININSTGAHFHNEVGTAKTIQGKNYGTFDKGYSENKPVVQLPSNASLAKLAGFAASGSTSFAAGNSDGPESIRTRIEFIAADIGSGGTDSTGVDEGFIKMYTAKTANSPPSGYPSISASQASDWVRGDWTTTKTSARNCGAWYRVTPGGPLKFFPASVHLTTTSSGTTWFKSLLIAGGMTNTQATTASNRSLDDIMKLAGSRCFLGGDPHLVAEERNSPAFTNAQKQKGGDDTTFTVDGVRGTWATYPGPKDPRVIANRKDVNQLFPIYRGLNTGTKGVIHVAGSVGISGVLRGKLTLYATHNIVYLDDLRYASDPTVEGCPNMMGVIAGKNITVADNAFLNPPEIDEDYRNLDDTRDLFIHGVLMAIDQSFGVENYSAGPSDANGCEGTDSGRGCLYLNGGIIQERRGAVGLVAGQGFIKRYSYDRCAVTSPPPYFPTTGRFLDNRYYEIDPVRFDVAKLFARLTPGNN
ncbi:MAG TPA: hypothetical protein VNO75_01780 [Gemmatimonadaceae bacterium]|nr:hypothetical protein [Gemmatimonadaceae bacterium]